MGPAHSRSLPKRGGKKEAYSAETHLHLLNANELSFSVDSLARLPHRHPTTSLSFLTLTSLSVFCSVLFFLAAFRWPCVRLSSRLIRGKAGTDPPAFGMALRLPRFLSHHSLLGLPFSLPSLPRVFSQSFHSYFTLSSLPRFCQCLYSLRINVWSPFSGVISL